MFTPKFVVHTKKPVAIDSLDHQYPVGTKQDNYFNRVFNRKLEALISRRPLRILDLGCSGGGFVKSCLDGGHIAIGLEGSNYSKQAQRAEWATIPDKLFTCDITAPFTIESTDERGGPPSLARFDVITAWEVMEHIRAEDLPGVFRNVNAHLSDNGLFMMSVSTSEHVVDGVNMHQTVQEPPWWIEFFSSQGFADHRNLVQYFDLDWVRGPLQNSLRGFNVVLGRSCEPVPEPPSSFVLARDDLVAAVWESLTLGLTEYALYLCEVHRRRYPGDVDVHRVYAIAALSHAFRTNMNDERAKRALAQLGVNIQIQSA